MAKHNSGIPASGATLLLLFILPVTAHRTIEAPVSFETSNAAIASGPIGSVISDLSHDKSEYANIKARIACTGRLMQAGGDEHCLAILRSLVIVPHRKCCNAMADLDQEAPECWDYLISGPRWEKRLFTLNELCVARSIV
jgi:hypothetical protein